MWRYSTNATADHGRTDNERVVRRVWRKPPTPNEQSDPLGLRSRYLFLRYRVAMEHSHARCATFLQTAHRGEAGGGARWGVLSATLVLDHDRHDALEPDLPANLPDAGELFALAVVGPLRLALHCSVDRPVPGPPDRRQEAEFRGRSEVPVDRPGMVAELCLQKARYTLLTDREKVDRLMSATCVGVEYAAQVL